MIKRFSVQNFSSIKDRMDISFEASKLDDDTSYNNVFKHKYFDILKLSAFYGMNASGKSTIIRAFAALRELIVPNQIKNVLPYYPFDFSEETRHAPIYLEIEFAIDENSPIYRYYISYNEKYILEEKLEKLASQKPTMLYERKTTNDFVNISLGQTIKNNLLLQEIKKTIVSNAAFLSSFSRFNIEDLHDVYNFFYSSLINITPEITRFDDILPVRIQNDSNLKEFTTRLLKAADFNITSVDVKKTNMQTQAIGAPFMLTAEKDTLVLYHEGEKNKGSIEFLKESLGTKKIIIIASHLYQALSKPSVLIVDELESSLHPELTKLIIKCFLDETINPHNSQLIFTSHQTTLLNLNLLRRDQINFVYKDEKTCGSYIRSLKDFHVRKTDSVEKSYLAGRYLTSPNVKEQLLEGAVNE